MDDEFLALHGLLVKKAGGAHEIASLTGQAEDVIAKVLDEAVRSGRVVSGAGKYMLTPLGREHLEGGYPVVCADLRDNPAFVSAYERFEPVNRKLLALFTRWQMVGTGSVSVPNDHSDPAYDGKVIDQLGDLHERFEPVMAAFVAAVPRFDRYRQRLDAAYDKVLAGDHDYVSGARLDSYHTVWFEMHEDLLRMLGRTREEA